MASKNRASFPRTQKFSSRRVCRLFAYSAATELLETRLLFANITSKAVTGDWSLASTWVGGVVPSIYDSATIVSGAHISVTQGESVEALNTQVGSDLSIVNFNGSTPVFSLDNYNTSDSSLIAGSLEIGSSTAFAVNGGNATAATAPVIASGNVTLTGDLEGSVFTNTGTLTMDGGGVYGGNLLNQGTVNVIANTALLGNGGSFVNDTNGVFNLTVDTGFQPSTYNAIQSGNFINKGTLNKTSGGTFQFPDYTADETFNGGTFENIGGTVNVNSGTFLVKGGAYLAGGAINVAANSVFTFDDPSTQLYNSRIGITGTVTGSGAGSIDFAAGDYQPRDPTGIGATDGTLDFPAGLLTVGNIAIDTYGDAYIHNAGFMTFNSPVQTGGIWLLNDGTIQNVGAGNLTLTQLDNHATGVIDLQTDGGLVSGTVNRPYNLLNLGTLKKSGGTGVSAMNAVLTNNGGTIDVETGTLNFNTATTSLYEGGPIIVATGAVMDIGTTSSWVVSGPMSSTGGGIVQLTANYIRGRNFTDGSEGTAPGVLDFAPGTFYVTGGYIDSGNEGLTNAGTINFETDAAIGSFTNDGTVYLGAYQMYFNGSIVNDPTGVFNFQGDATITIKGDFTNNGTIIKSGGTGTVALSAFGQIADYDNSDKLKNHGTIEAQSGTIELPDDVFITGSDGNLDNPAGSIVKADAGASITVVPSWDSTSTTITTNDGTLSIGGLGALFPAAQSLVTNNGTFAVLSGASFTTAGDFTNTGMLTVGGTFTVTGNYTQAVSGSTTPVLDFSVGAAAASAAAPNFNVSGSTTLAGNLTAEFSGGFAAAGGTAYTVAHFAQSAIGAFSSTVGVAPDFSASVGSTSIALNSNAVAAADLSVGAVTAPAGFVPGQAGAITWQVTDASAAAGGSWTDSVYLSADGTVNPGDLLLGRVIHTGGLAVGANYTGTLSAIFPAAAGSYQVVVVADSGLAVPDINRTNNVADSAATVSSLPALTLGGSVIGTISSQEDLLYTLTLPAGTDVRLTAAVAAPLITDIEVARGTVPTSTAYDFIAPLNASSLTLVTTITQPRAGVYYIRLHGQAEAGAGQSFTLSAASVGFGAFSLTPTTVGAALTTLSVNGAGFTAGSTAQLLDGGNNVVVTASSAIARDANTLLLNFDLIAVPVGTYSVKITSGTQATTLAGALTVQAPTTTIAPVQFSISGPSVVRYGRSYDYFITYTNPNNVDVPAPLFEVYQPNAAFELFAGNVGADINPDSVYTDGAIELLALNQEGNAGVLPANYTGVLGVREDPINNIPHSPLNLTLAVVQGGSTFDLSTLVRPGSSGVSLATTEVLAAMINGQSALPTDAAIGTSAYPTAPNLTVSTTALGNYLDGVATELSSGGFYTANVGTLLATATDAADAFGVVTRGQNGGAFGEGTPDPLNYQIVPSVDGSYVDFVSPSGSEQFLVSGTTYTAGSPLDTSTLAAQSDGTLRLTEEDGSFYQFNSSLKLDYIQSVAGAKTTYNYDTAGQVTSVVGPTGTTSYVYNSAGVITSLTNAFGIVTTYGYQTVPGPVTTYGGAPGQVQLLSTITTTAGTTTITYTPTPAGQISGTINYLDGSPVLAYLPVSISLPDGSGQDFIYDGFGRLIKSTLLDGSAPVTYSYDSTGLAVTIGFADGSSESELRGPGGIALKVTDRAGGNTLFSYGPNYLLSSLVNPDGTTASLTYDSQNEFDGGISASGATSKLTFDSQGRVTGITDGNGNTVVTAYGTSGNTASRTFPDGSQTQYGYDSIGQINQITSRGGIVTSITRNTAGQVTQTSYSDGTSMSYTYDANGHMVTSTNAQGTTTYTYNAAQEVTRIAYPGGQSVSYLYDANGRTSQESDQAGVLESFTYDADARLSRVLDAAGNLMVAYSYDIDGRISMASFGNGTKTVYGYDAAGHTASITNLGTDNSVQSSITYTFNATDRPITATDSAGNVTTYAYDAIGELTQVVLPGGRTISYTYDADGNRTSVVDSAGTNSAAYSVNNLDQYTAVGSATFTYDRNGNMLSMTNGSGTTTYTYAADGRLATSSGPGGNYTYAYNALGQLDSYTLNGVVTHFLLDSAGNVIAAYDGSGNLIANYHYGLQLLTQQTAAGVSSYYDFDLVGNTTATTGSTGAIVNQYSYLPFGEKLSSTGPAGNLFTFSGANGLLDLGDGFFQTANRVYSPTLGRFIQPDPSTYTGGDVNLYRYAGNEPTLMTDPSGLDDPIKPVNPGTGPNTDPNRYRPPQQPPTPPTTTTPPVEPGPATAPGDTFTPSTDLTNEGGIPSPTEGGVPAETEAGLETAAETGTELETVVEGAATGPLGVGVLLLGLAAWGLGAEDDSQIITHVETQLPPEIVTVLDTIPHTALPAPRIQQPNTPSKVHEIVNYIHYYPHILEQQIKQTVVVWITQLINAFDPNEISGPIGGGAARFITAYQPLSYNIAFENKPTASAPAQTVTVTSTLDPSVDLSTFQLTSIGWGSVVLSVPAGLQSYSDRVSYVQPDTGKTILVDVEASLDRLTRVLTWTFTTLDPTTLDTPVDALAGFLPPDDSTGRGTGYVSYTVDPLKGLTTGVAISAVASIVFDQNAAISTSTWTNTIDSVAPTSTITALPATQSTTYFNLSWAGSDDAGGSGIAGYTIFVSTDGGAYTALLTDTTSTSTAFAGSPGHMYSFYSVAVDGAGNLQTTPTTAQATTAVPAIARTLKLTTGHPVKFIDAGGKPVTITLTGPGTGTLSFLTATGSADPIAFVLTGTTARSSINVTDTSGLTLSAITVNGSLANFSAPKANFIGGFSVTGTLGTLTLANVTAGAPTISIGTAGVATSFRLGAINGLAITTAGTIRSLSAASWAGTAASDSLTAVSIGSMQIKGAFDASITLSTAALALTSFTSGAITGGTWTITGSGRTISSTSIAAAWAATFTGAITSLTVRGDMAGSITAGSIVRLQAGSITNAAVTLSGKLTSLVVKGTVSGSISAASAGTIQAGSLTGATIHLTGGGTALTSLTVNGTVTSSTLAAAGNIGRITVGGATGSTFFAGVSSSITSTLPTSADFTTASVITSFVDRGKSAFSNTFIAAASVGTASLSDVTTANGGVPFGIATRSLKSFTLQQPKQKTFHFTSKQSSSVLATLPADLTVEILT